MTIPPPDINVNLPPMEVTNNITVMSDSVRLARIADAVEALAQAIAECGCTQPTGTSTVVRIGQGALVLAAFFIGFQVKRVADGYHDSGDPKTDPVSDPQQEDYGEGDGSH